MTATTRLYVTITAGVTWLPDHTWAAWYECSQAGRGPDWHGRTVFNLGFVSEVEAQAAAQAAVERHRERYHPETIRPAQAGG